MIFLNHLYPDYPLWLLDMDVTFFFLNEIYTEFEDEEICITIIELL